MFHYVGKGSVGIVDNAVDAVDYLIEIMRRNIRCHTDRDTDRSVYEQIWESRGKNRRLLLFLVEVGHEIDSCLFDVGKHLVSQA